MKLALRRLATQDQDFDAAFSALLDWSNRVDSEIVKQTQHIIDTIKEEGDQALLRYTQQFDRRRISKADELEISSEAMRSGWERLPKQDREDLQSAASRIWAYHESQNSTTSPYEDEYGNQLSVRTTAIDRVGVYVPGGQASYPSTVFMTVIPAKVAGVQEVVVSVPMPEDQISDHMLGALYLVQPQKCFSIGGAQAIAAMAFGTESVPIVDKIVGPGGAYVAAAKKLVFGPVGIESLAGPSEILVIADGSVPASWIAWDLMSQAEHDSQAQSILISPDNDYLSGVENEINQQLEKSPRADIIQASLNQRGALIHARNLDEAFGLANRIAPEHLEIATENPKSHLPKVKHAGAIFLGGYSSEALGDYIAGPSHVLPTFGTARYASVLGVPDFVKRTSIIEISKQGAQPLGRIASRLAQTEGLHAHAEAARSRLDGYGDNE